MIYLAISISGLLGIAIGAIVVLSFLAWLDNAAPTADHDFLSARDWRDEAEAKVEQLKNPDHAAMRKWIRGDDR